VKTKNVFIIITPLQLINAIEYKEQYLKESTNTNILFVINYLEKTKEQIKQVLEFSQWDEVHFVFNHSVTYSSRIKGVLYHLLFSFYEKTAFNRINNILVNQKPDFIAIGNYYNRICYKLLQKHNYSNAIVLDDGMNSMSITSIRGNEINQGKNHFLLKKFTPKKKIELGLMGIGNRPIERSITFYSSFIKAVDNNDRLVINGFHFFSSLFERKRKGDFVYFIGSPFVELGIISQTTYFRFLDNIKNYYSEPVIYIAHRLERDYNLEKIKTILSVKRLVNPIEIELIKLDILPGKLASFYSAALITISKIFSNRIEVNSFLLPFEEVNKISKEMFIDVYSTIQDFQGDNFKLIDILIKK